MYYRSSAVVIYTMQADGLENRPNLDLAQADLYTGEHGYRPWKAPAVAVEHGQRPQVLRELRHRPTESITDRIEICAAVMRHDSLRIASRTRCVRYGDRIPFIFRT